MPQFISDLITYKVLGIENQKIAAVVDFFIYDSIKILILIFIVVSVINFIRTFFEASLIKEKLGKLPFGLGNLTAAMFGAITPFCSCSSIPLFIGFIESGLSIGIAFSFLIASPLVNEVAFVIMGGLFGWKLALMYAASGIILGTFGGIIIGAMKMDKEIILESNSEKRSESHMPKKFSGKIRFALRVGYSTLKKLLPYVIGGVAIGALIHGYVPQEFFTNTIGKYQLLSVPIATIIGVPIYAGCSTIVPLIFSITANGVPLGTSLAFMMAIAGLSLPEAVILKRVMSLKLLLTFFGLVAVGIMIIGYLFNALA